MALGSAQGGAGQRRAGRAGDPRAAGREEGPAGGGLLRPEASFCCDGQLDMHGCIYLVEDYFWPTLQDII